MGKFLVHKVALDLAMKHNYPFVVRPADNESDWFIASLVDKDLVEYEIVTASDEITARGFCTDYGLVEKKPE